jgi:hypothetical protein
MKKSDLKRVLKPLIKECVKEAILEEGILSGIIAEVARGVGVLSAAPASAPEPAAIRMQRNAFSEQPSTKLTEQKRRLMEAVGKQAYNGVNLFEGTTPAPSQSSPTQQASPVAGIAPGDKGVDISGLFGSAATNWTAHMEKVKE